MTKKPIDHFSLSDLRKSIEDHEHPLFTLTKAEMEALVSRLEAAAEFFEYDVSPRTTKQDPQKIRAFAWYPVGTGRAMRCIWCNKEPRPNAGAAYMETSNLVACATWDCPSANGISMTYARWNDWQRSMFLRREFDFREGWRASREDGSLSDYAIESFEHFLEHRRFSE